MVNTNLQTEMPPASRNQCPRSVICLPCGDSPSAVTYQGPANSLPSCSLEGASRKGDQKNCHSSRLCAVPEGCKQVFCLCVWPVSPGLTSLYTPTHTGYFHIHSNKQLKKKLKKKKEEVIRLKWKLKCGSK